MKWKIIMEKFHSIKNEWEVKEAIIDISTSPKAVVNRIEKYGWRVQYLVPVLEMVDDPDTIFIETGGKI